MDLLQTSGLSNKLFDYLSPQTITEKINK